MALLGALLLAQKPDPNVVVLSCLAPGLSLHADATKDGSRLTLWHGDRSANPVKKPDDLRGGVRIATAADALEFVRFLRSPGVWPFLFDKPAVEIRHQPVRLALPPALYADLRIYTISGWDGVLSDKDWSRLRLPEPKVGGGGDKEWFIRRPCLFREAGEYRTGTLVERVSTDGRYVGSVVDPEPAPARIHWTITEPARR